MWDIKTFSPWSKQDFGRSVRWQTAGLKKFQGSVKNDFLDFQSKVFILF